MIVELREWWELANETTEEPKVVKADVVLQSKLWEAALKKKDAQTVEVAELRKLLAAMKAKSSKLSAKNGELYDGVRREIAACGWRYCVE